MSSNQPCSLSARSSTSQSDEEAPVKAQSDGGGLRDPLLVGVGDEEVQEGSFLRLCVSQLPLLGLLITWIAMAEIVQGLEDHYEKPYIISWCVHCGYLSTLPVGFVLRWYQNKKRVKRGHPAVALDYRSLLTRATAFSFLCQACSTAWYLSLPLTTVGVNTTIYQSSAIFVFMLSYFFLKEKATFIKLFAVGCGLGGVALIAFFPHASQSEDDSSSTSDKPSNTTGGIVLVLVSAMLFAIYEVLWSLYGNLKRENISNLRKEDERVEGVIETSMLFGFIGAANLVILWLPCIPLHYLGWETFEWPNNHSLELLVSTVGLDAIFNWLLLVGIVFTSPLVMSVGMMLAIPAGMVADVIVHGLPVTLAEGMGALMVAVGFVLLHVSQEHLLRLAHWCKSSCA